MELSILSPECTRLWRRSLRTILVTARSLF